jgi:DNA-directed RNA polymerase subunit RPC12/RpoP
MSGQLSYGALAVGFLSRGSGATLNSVVLHQIATMNAKTVLGSVAIAILLFFGVIFAWSSSYSELTEETANTRLLIAGMFFIVALVIGYYITRSSKTIVQKLEVSGDMKAVAIKCPHCSASMGANAIKMVQGVPYATCPYCGHTFEVTEEPKW